MTYDTLLERIQNAQLLVLDDIGTEKRHRGQLKNCFRLSTTAAVLVDA